MLMLKTATAVRTPFASRCPKPSSGTLAPAPANSASGAYSPTAESTTQIGRAHV